MTKRKLFVFIIIFFITVSGSFGIFKSVDASKDNYIHIGVLKNVNITLTGSLYRYSTNERKRYSAYKTWLNDITTSILGKYFNFYGISSKSLNANRVKNIDSSSTSLSYIAMFHAGNFLEKNNFSPKSIILEVRTPSKIFSLDYELLKEHTVFFDYIEDDDLFEINVENEKTSGCFIDLKKILAPVFNESSITIKFHTKGDTVNLDIK